LYEINFIPLNIAATSATGRQYASAVDRTAARDQDSISLIDLHLVSTSSPETELNFRLKNSKNIFSQKNLNFHSNELISYYFTIQNKNKIQCQTQIFQAKI
jgi:hypothetical protein